MTKGDVTTQAKPAVYVEQNCTFEHNGRTFESGGAVVTPERIIAYPRDGGILGDWHGAVIGTWRSIASWPMPRAWIAPRMYQIEAAVNGVVYTGRGCGAGMLYRGKRKRGRP